MWLLFGLGAVLFALINLAVHFRGKDSGYFRFISMSLTALTLCDFYYDGARRVIAEDWGGLTDIMPTVSKMLWILTLGSILINSLSLVTKNRK